MRWPIRSTCFLAMFLFCTSSYAQSGGSPVELDAGTETKLEEVQRDFDEAIKDLGELAGEVNACLKADSLPKHTERVADLYNSITRLFGTQRGFLFASSYGYGSANENAAGKCEALTDEFEDRYGAISKKYNLID